MYLLTRNVMHAAAQEKANGAFQLVDVPEGFWSRSVLPYDATLQSLLPSSHIGHERSRPRYQQWLKIRPQDYIQKTMSAAATAQGS